MKFKFKEETNVNFRKLVQKDVFSCNHNFYMKIETCQKKDEQKNSVDLKDGSLLYFSQDCAVEKVNATLVMT